MKMITSTEFCLAQVFLTKTDTMRRLLHLVSHSYIYWCSGEVDTPKAEALIYKFLDRYQFSRTSQQRYRAKKNGECSVKAVFWKDGPRVRWWLLATEGEGLIKSLEQLKNAENKMQRITVYSDYELVKTPRKSDQAAWSWRMTKSCSEEWKNRIKKAVRQRNNMHLRQIFYSLRRVPGFHNLRRDAFKFTKYAESEWKRSRKGAFPVDEIYIGWLGKFRTPKTIDISELKAD